MVGALRRSTSPRSPAPALVYWQASQNGYQLVLAPEGVPQVSVNWYALLAPVLGWIGAGLLAYRLADLRARPRPRDRWPAPLRPLAGELAPTVAATMGRQRRLLARAVALVALTAAFAASTAVFNATYQQQAEVDARLTNGADVTVTESPGARVGPHGRPRGSRRCPGVAQRRAAAAPLRLRRRRPAGPLRRAARRRSAAAGKLQDAWFAGGTAGGLMSALAARPDGVLVSRGDRPRLPAAPRRPAQPAPAGRPHQAASDRAVPLRRRRQGVPDRAEGLVLRRQRSLRRRARPAATRSARSSSRPTARARATVARPRPRASSAPSAQVTDIVDQRQVVGSNLTAVELSGLTRVELGFALVLAVAATGLALGARLPRAPPHVRDRRARSARAARQLGGFVWGESLFVTGAGLLLGAGDRRAGCRSCWSRCSPASSTRRPTCCRSPGATSATLSAAVIACRRGRRSPDAALAAPPGHRRAARPVSRHR